MIAELRLDFPACLAADFPAETPVAVRAVDRVLAAIHGSTFAPLEERSPGLRGSNFVDYLRCSQARMVHAANSLRRHGVTGGRVLDYGGYFGNFSLMFADLGFEVEVLDAYRLYQPSLAPILDLLKSERIRIHDFDTVGRDAAGLAPASYDVVLCMGVIEHVPHTPRVLLEPLNRVLKTGGVLVMDTPNFAQLTNRQKLARGEAVMTPISVQYGATIPFEGHHREYTVDEMVWMVQALGHQPLACELFNYSEYAYRALNGRDVTNHWRMVATPTLRELIMVVSRKTATPPATMATWTAVFEDPERYWQQRLPQGIQPESGEEIAAIEPLVAHLQDEVLARDRAVAERDRMLADLQAAAVNDVAVRDAEIASLNQRLGKVQSALDRTPSERLKRAFRRLTGAS